MIIKGTSCYANVKSGNLVSINESGKITQEEIYDLKPKIKELIKKY